VKRLYKYLITSFLGPFVFTFFIVIFLLLMQFLWKYIEDLAGKGLEFSILAELLFYVSASLVPMALPLAVLLASLMTLGNLGENNELTALKSSGISLQRIVMPLVYFSLGLAIFAFLFANYIVPITNLKMSSMIYDITKQKPELQIKEGVFYNGVEGYSIRIGKRDYKSNLLHDIKIYDHTLGNGNTRVTLADSGYMRITSDKKFLFVTLFNGYNYSEEAEKGRQRYYKKTYPFRRDKFEKEEIHIEMVGFGLNRTDENLFRQSSKMMSLRQLTYNSDSLQKELNQRAASLKKNLLTKQIFRYSKPRVFQNKALNDSSRKDTVRIQSFESIYNKLTLSEKTSIIGQALSYARDSKTYISSASTLSENYELRIRKFNIEWWRKFTLSAACLIFFFIGAPLGAIIRKGGLGMPVVISVSFFVVYYIISLLGEKFGREGMISAALGMWISAFILLPTGIFLIRKATKDSAIFNIDTYLNYVKKVIVIFNSKRHFTAGKQ
jgi:lipopolysaccharide export system permease protein